MSEHDEFCPMQHGDGLCRCYILRKARADERKKIAAAIEAEARASVALSHDPDCQTFTLEGAGNDE